MSAPYPILDISRTPPIPFVRIVRVELRKAFDTLASFWLMVGIAVLTVIVEGTLLVIGLANQGTDPFGFTFFTTSMGFILQPALAVVTVMLVTSEWGQRTAMVTFALEARRARVVWAKLVGALLLMLVAIAIVLAVALLCTAVLEVGNADHTDWDFGPGDFLGLVLFDTIAVLLGYALGTVLLNTPAGVLAFPVALYVIPAGLGFVGLFSDGFNDFQRWINLQGAQGSLLTWSLDTSAEWGHLLVSLILWVVVPLVVGQTRVMQAEVK